MQKINQKFKIRQFFIVLSTILFITSTSIVLAANDTNAEELKEQQQKLQELLDKIGDVREERAEQRVILEKLNKKMECNWTLIQNYDTCEKKHKDQKQEQLGCVQQAKNKARECLSEIDDQF